VNLISAISNQGKLRFTLYEDNMTQQKLIIFCKRLIKTVGHKVFLILDNLKVHHGKLFKKWVADNKAVRFFICHHILLNAILTSILMVF
jgi:hypothetical protein